MNHEIENFVESYVKELREGNAALFAGAGLSMASGFVDWIGLLKPVAISLGLDSRKEADLVGLAQFHVNANGTNRGVLNQLLVEKFSDLKKPSQNHEIIARLPIKVFWTTNYDRLIETALVNGGKRVDAKYDIGQMATTKPGRDAIVYKMHGDIEHPNAAVLTKDDYEKYHASHAPFTTALLGDLVERTFLFIGFSFTDPNLAYLLARIRFSMGTNQRQHFCITKRRSKATGESDEDFLYAEVRQNLIVQDLLRFNVKTIFVDSYADITTLLATVENRFRRKTIFVSGSAVEYGGWGETAATGFITTLARLLIQHDYRITSGFGLGVGGSVVSGAVQEIYSTDHRSIEQQLVLRPFPIGIADAKERENTFARYRNELVNQAGIAIFLLGNKTVLGKTVLAGGVKDEFALARDHGLFVIPVGASEYVARELWDEVWKNYATYFSTVPSEAKPLFEKLGVATNDPNTLLETILKLVAILSEI